uniref:hypothetical protein n=1 Tax=Streptobacillus moniliformis TaxID=34105 RepID=UPI000A912162
RFTLSILVSTSIAPVLIFLDFRKSSALNNLLFSTFTNKVSSTLGINDFKIKANFDYKNNLEFKDIIN